MKNSWSLFQSFQLNHWLHHSMSWIKLWQSPWPRKVEELWVPKDWAIFSLCIWRSLVRQNICKASGTMVEFLQYVRFMLWFSWLLRFLSNLFRWMKKIAHSLQSDNGSPLSSSMSLSPSTRPSKVSTQIFSMDTLEEGEGSWACKMPSSCKEQI